jgi:hypothetical protein
LIVANNVVIDVAAKTSAEIATQPNSGLAIARQIAAKVPMQ